MRSCPCRGVAIDLVLDRPRENRSQLVFTRIQGGREGTFWQSARTTSQARPGIRVPRRRAADLAHLTILVDSRERYPYKFAHQQATTERRALPAGDYGIAHDRELLVGATFVGAQVAELLHAATIAIVAEVPLATLAHAVPAFPTRSELWLKFLEAYEARRGHSLHSRRAGVRLT